MKKLFGGIFVFVLAGLFAKTGLAEEKSGKGLLDKIAIEEAKQTEAQKEVRTLYDEGFTMVGQDDMLKIGAWMQNDVRIFPKGHPGVTQFLVRRARLDFKGSLEKMFGFRLMGEFEGDNGTNTANLKEGWVEYNQFPEIRIKIGQFKEPFGLENLYSDLHLDLIERPMAENFIRPEQDLGLMVFGKIFGKRLEYGLGVFNGSGTNVAENNDDKDFAGRIAFIPVKHLTVGSSMTYGKQTSTLDNTGPTTAAGTHFLTFVNPTAGADVQTNRVRMRAGGDVEWFTGPFSLKGEYVFNHFRGITFGGTSRSWDMHGFSGQTTYILTGEEKSNSQAFVPKKPFNPKEGTWGAIEWVGRLETLRSDQGLIDAGFATGTDDLWSLTSGINWYWNRHVQISANYIFVKFDDTITNANGDEEHAGLLRFQFNL